MAKRKFTTQQKLDILKEAATHGVKETLAKHDVYLYASQSAPPVKSRK